MNFFVICSFVQSIMSPINFNYTRLLRRTVGSEAKDIQTTWAQLSPRGITRNKLKYKTL